VIAVVVVMVVQLTLLFETGELGRGKRAALVSLCKMSQMQMFMHVNAPR
jgi:cobalamin synthase